MGTARSIRAHRAALRPQSIPTEHEPCRGAPHPPPPRAPATYRATLSPAPRASFSSTIPSPETTAIPPPPPNTQLLPPQLSPHSARLLRRAPPHPSTHPFPLTRPPRALQLAAGGVGQRRSNRTCRAQHGPCRRAARNPCIHRELRRGDVPSARLPRVPTPHGHTRGSQSAGCNTAHSPNAPHGPTQLLAPTHLRLPLPIYINSYRLTPLPVLTNIVSR